MDLNLRIQILKDAGQISEETRADIIKTIDMFSREYSIELTEENGAMLITHLCVALERVKKGEIVNRMDSILYGEIKNSAYYRMGQEAVSKIENTLDMAMPQEEQEFIIMHLCVLFENEANKK